MVDTDYIYKPEVRKSFDLDAWDSGGVTLDEIRQWMQDNDIPLYAKIEYEGCGTHNIVFVWEAREGEERDKLIREREAIYYPKRNPDLSPDVI